MKKTYNIVIILFYYTVGFGQSSYLKILEGTLPTPSILNNQIAIDNGELSYVFQNPQSAFKLIQLSFTGDIVYSATIGTNLSEGQWSPISPFSRKGNWHLIIGNGRPFLANKRNAVFVVNLETGVAWCRQISKLAVRTDRGIITESGKVFCSNYLFPVTGTAPTLLGIAHLELETGVQQWNYHYEKTGGISATYYFVDMKELSSNSLSVLTEVLFNNQLRSYALLKIAIDGTVQQSVGIANDSLIFLSQSVDAQFNIYVTGNKQYYGASGLLQRPYGFIIKMDSNYNVIWAKKLFAEEFDCYDLEIEAFPNGDLIFSYLSQGHLPVITGKISADGDLLWYKGYAVASPRMAIGDDGSIFFSSQRKYYEDGSSESAHLLIKTTPDGEIEGCPQFDTCLEMEDIEMVFETWEWERTDAPLLPSIDVNVEPISFSAYDHCGAPPPPQADFYFPDTICQFSCLSPDSLKSKLATHIEWTLSGPNIDTTFIDSTFNWCFDSIGTYTIEQEIWLLGCSEFFSQTVEVLPDNLEVSLGEDRFICETPYTLLPQGSRPLQTFLWNNGSENNSLSIFQSGEYILHATDGYCVDNDTVVLTRVAEWLTEEPLILPPDETVCPDLLPFILRPESFYTTTFYLNDTQQDSVFSLTKAGNYTVSVDIENCIFSKNFNLTIEGCQVPIYLANTFSPNDDGINDFIFPQGQDFEGVKFEIYNRWGDLVFETQTAPFRWNGKFDGKKVNTGVYIMVFTYFNQRNLVEEVISQDVLLMR